MLRYQRINIPDETTVRYLYGSEVEKEITSFLEANNSISLPDKVKAFGNILHTIGKKYHVDEDVEETKDFYSLNIENTNKTIYCARSKDEQIEYLKDYYSTNEEKKNFHFELEEDNSENKHMYDFTINNLLLKMFVEKKNVKTCDQYGFSPHLLLCSGPKNIMILVRILNNFFTITEDIKNSFEFISKVKFSMAMKKKYNNKADPKDFSVMRPRAKFSLCGSIVDRSFADRLKHECDYKEIWSKAQMSITDASASVIASCKSIYTNKTKGEFLCFLDLKDAYTSVDRNLLFNILEYYLDPKFANHSKKYYRNFMKYSTGYVDNPDKFFEIKKGIVQGTNASHILFKIYMNRYIELFVQGMKHEKYGIQVYVDDIVVKGVGQRQLKKMLMIFERLNLMFNFKFSPDKLRILTNDYPQFTDIGIKPVELGFRYLGGYIYHDPWLLRDYLTEILVRDKFGPIIKMAKNSMHFLALVKKNIYNVCVHYLPKSFLIYSSNPMSNPIIIMLKELRSLFSEVVDKFDDKIIQENLDQIIILLQMNGLIELNNKFTKMNDIFSNLNLSDTKMNVLTEGTKETLEKTIEKTSNEFKERNEKLEKILRKESFKRNIGDSYENFAT